jgi:FAD/FMN-containing dehydrogenase
MAASASSKLPSLGNFLDDSNIKYATPKSPDFESLRATYSLDNHAMPLAIVRPQRANDVAAPISYSTANGIPFVVRSSGNNIIGQSWLQDALMIDMRDISYVRIDETRSSAKIGGGIISSTLIAELSKEELATAFASIPFVGHTGWSTYGGYGPFSANYGLGLDNIIAAKVVNWKCEVVDADKKMLKVIRGAGGVIGVIVELAIKVYPLKKVGVSWLK